MIGILWLYIDFLFKKKKLPLKKLLFSPKRRLLRIFSEWRRQLDFFEDTLRRSFSISIQSTSNLQDEFVYAMRLYYLFY